MKPPTFFISSTIFDFRDLRSAIKFYLEEQGCKVLASEFNDFQKPLDRHSYEACLAAIDLADYFILLIGARVGGWFDQEKRISITQQEYRHAYERQKAGKLKILTFVRSEVWQVREERKELGAYLASWTLSDTEKTKIREYPSKFTEDAAFLAEFLHEVGRNRSTAKAVKTGGALPPGNWIHVFQNFGDIIAALQVQAFSGIPVEESALRRLLQSEIKEMLRKCVPKVANVGMPLLRKEVEMFLAEYPLTVENKSKDAFEIDTQSWDRLTWYAFHLFGVQFFPMILNSAVSSAAFLEFDVTRNAFRETPVHLALVRLKDELRRFSESNKSENLEVVFENTPKQRLRRDGTVWIEPAKLGGLLHLYDRWINIIELCVAVYRYLDGKPFVEPVLRSRSPVRGMEERINQEVPTEDEIEVFIELYDKPLRPTSEMGESAGDA